LHPAFPARRRPPGEEEKPALFKPTLYIIRFLMILVVLAALSMLLTSPPDPASPYLSALSTISASPAIASTCAMTSCGRDKEGQLICTSSGSLTNCGRSHKCSTTNC